MKPFHVLAKPIGAACELDCSYCFYNKTGTYGRMPTDVHEAYVKQYLESQPDGDVEFAAQGGEPTLVGLAHFNRQVKLTEKYRRPGQNIRHVLQTHGGNLSKSWLLHLKQHNYLVGLSMDGPAELHDANRVTRTGNPTHKQTARAADELTKHGIEFNILCTLNSTNVHHPLKVYRYFRDEIGAKVMQFIPIVGGEHEITGEEYGEFMCTVFDEWLVKDAFYVFVRAFENALSRIITGNPASCVTSPTCGSSLCLERDGKLYSCDHFVKPEHELGNILDTHMGELAANEQQLKFGNHKASRSPDCRSCEVEYLCNGGCPKDWDENNLNKLCAGYKRFFKHAEPGLVYAKKLMEKNP